ncbi:abl interactor homolog [Dendrobium catenatum]|uniref:abl interactor homolog n=1 Tax=Dendrobium catenatum TaxID=906689 RepID=UPI0009F3834B|nr:abl interactor homolog [Dendrobium catenatum]
MGSICINEKYISLVMNSNIVIFKKITIIFLKNRYLSFGHITKSQVTLLLLQAIHRTFSHYKRDHSTSLRSLRFPCFYSMAGNTSTNVVLFLLVLVFMWNPLISLSWDNPPPECPACLPPPSTECPPPPPSQPSSYSPPPPGSIYYYSPPPPPSYVPYYSPPTGYFSTPPPPNPIIPWFPWYYQTPPSASSGCGRRKMGIWLVNFAAVSFAFLLC